MTTSSEVSTPRGDFVTFLSELLRSAHDDIASAESVVRAKQTDDSIDDPESIRKLRLAFRRIQYQLESISEVEPTLHISALVLQLHDVTRPFGRLRDVEVLESRLAKVLGRRGVSPEGMHVKEIAEATLRTQQLEAHELLDSPRFTRAVEELVALQGNLSESLVLPLDVHSVARRTLRHSWRELRRAVKRARRDNDNARLHEVRISTKRMMYATQAFATLLGPPAEELVARLDALQHYLGTQHDHVIAAAWFKEVGAVHPQLNSLMKTTAARERRRAFRQSKGWRHHWKLVKDLQPRHVLLGTQR